MIGLSPDTMQLASQLYPFCATRQSKDLRLGMLTIAQKWEYLLQHHLSHYPKSDHAGLTSAILSGLKRIPGNWIPSIQMVQALAEGKEPAPEKVLEYPWQLFQWNDEMIRMDFEILTRNRHSQPIPETVQVIQSGNIFIEEGVSLSHCILNASHGPIYLAAKSEIMEGAIIRGPFYLGEGSMVKMGARIYGATTIGPHCVVGGEIKNSVILGYSNKAHDGYLGDSVIGEWCNLGAGTTVSNLRNNAGPARVWSMLNQHFVEAAPKCGLLMGDYSRSAIQTAFNTGTMVGIGANVFGNGLTPKYIPDFSWGMEGTQHYEWEKVIRDLSQWKLAKGHHLSDPDIQMLKILFDRSIR